MDDQTRGREDEQQRSVIKGRETSSHLHISTRLDVDVSSRLTHGRIPHMSKLHPRIGLPATVTVKTSQPHDKD